MSTASVPMEKPRGLEPKWKVLISVLFGIFMIILDSTIVNIAFPTLRVKFGASVTDAQWVISIYVLALGVTTPVSGFLADRFHIKRVYLLGLGVFTLGSLLCGFAPSLGLLIAARALQGIGGGMSQPLGPAQLFRAFPPKEQGTALGIFGIALVVAPALGPLLGGWLIDINLWRLIFFINVPIGILGVFLGSRFLLDYRTGQKPLFDPLGLLTAIIGFGAVLYAATVAETNGWTGALTLTLFGVGAAALIAHAIIELRFAKDPLMNLRIFSNRTFLNASLVGYVATLALFGAEFLMPLYLQAFRGRTALEAGVILLAVAVTSGVTTPLAGRLFDKIGPRMIMMTGFTPAGHQHLATGAAASDHAHLACGVPAGPAGSGHWAHAANLVCHRHEQRSAGPAAARFVAAEQHALCGAGGVGCRPGHHPGELRFFGCARPATADAGGADGFGGALRRV